MFSVIDHLICPSYFLKRQYIYWGVAPQRISVIENLPAKVSNKRPTIRQDDRPLVVGYFGQVNPWKGLSLLIEAIGLARSQGAEVQLEVNGANHNSLQTVPSAVRFNGLYDPEELDARMARVDVVAMASIWYENSPMVIQEAYQHGLPVIAPDLGGMAEKVKHQRTGLLFTAGCSESLARQILQLSNNRDLLAVLQQGVRHCQEIDSDSKECHRKIYTSLLNK